MKQDNGDTNIKIDNNKGFSLIELLISITIMAIIVLPLLNNFVTSAKINSKAKRIQNETFYTQNLLEKLKAESMTDIAAMFDYPEDFSGLDGQALELYLEVNGEFKVVNEDNKSSVRTSFSDTDGNVDYSYKLIEKTDAPYYFALKNISINNRVYDALITLDPTAYIQEDENNITSFNTFKMPIITELDTEKNILALQENEDDLAVNEIYANHLAYCASLEAQNAHSENPVTVPYATKTEVLGDLKKDIVVSIEDTNGTVYGNVVFRYLAPEIAGGGSASYTISKETLNEDRKSIYIFYNPVSINQVEITQDDLIADTYDVYVVKQEREDSIPTITTFAGIVPSRVNLYSNLTNLPSSELVKRKEAKNRIYKITVKLYNAGSNFNENALCTQYISSKED